MTETTETSGRKQDAHLLIHLVKYESNKAHTVMGIKTASKRGRLKSRVLRYMKYPGNQSKTPLRLKGNNINPHSLGKNR